MDEQLEKKKRLQAEALGKMIYDENFQGTEGGVNPPSVKSSGMSFAYPSGLNPKEREAFDAYVKKMKRESEGMQ